MGDHCEQSGCVPVLPLPRTERIHVLQKHFSATFQQDPEFFIRVPGRVNLIGEHIDYCGYGVCPMAIEQDILLAVSVSKDSILKLTNTDNKYKDHECDIKNVSVSVGSDGPQWHSYFLCGVQGVLEHVPSSTFTAKGMRVAISGNIPHSSGLSSSSALVSAAALATTYALKMDLSKQKIANLSAECERYIGTQGGGMDQAIAFLASEGCAKLIEFSPLRSQDVMLPSGAVFVVAHSLARLNKAATADFNCRVVECRLASQIIAKKNNLNWEKLTKLSDLQTTLGASLDTMANVVKQYLPKEIYTKEEICQELEVTQQELEKTSLTPNTKHIKQFKLKQRALHVFEEALRVQRFYATCETFINGNETNTNDSLKSETTLKKLGELMNMSHDSLRDLYECSHTKLDRLVDLSRDIAYGARLTGAGWGGCTVALIKPENVDNYIKMVQDTFYKKMGVDDGYENLLFATAPNSGACIYTYQ